MSQFQHRACCHWHCCHTSETELSLMWLVALVSQNVCCERGLSNTKSNNVEKRKLHCMDEGLSAWSTSGRCPHCKDLRIQLYVYAQRHTYAYTHFFIRWMENHSNILNLTNTFQWQDQQRWKVQLIVIHQGGSPTVFEQPPLSAPAVAVYNPAPKHYLKDDRSQSASQFVIKWNCY